MTSRQLALTTLLSAALIGGPTCAPELSSTGGDNDGGPRQCIERTERAQKGLYSSISQLPEVPRLVLMFSNQADRDQTILQDVEFVEVLATWGVYRVTGPNPRIYMPGIIDTDGDRYGLTSQMCPGAVYGEFDQYNLPNIDHRVMGVWVGETVPRPLMDRPIQVHAWHGDWICESGYDWLGGERVPAGRVDYTYLDFAAPPPVGSYFSIQMVNFGPYGVPGPNVHGDGAIPLCCTEQNGCCLYDDAGCPPRQDPYCGDRNVDPGEECDDGGNVNGDGCDANCQFEPYCGDGTRDAGEQCDDGNNANNDGCSATCRFEPRCGDGHIDAGEVCDDGAQNGTVGYCNDDCTGPEEPPGGGSYCGDGTRDAGEQCDDGNNVNGDGCSATCRFEPRCGDGHIDAGEICDDGAQNGTVGYCNDDCTGPEEPPGGGGHCGDGTINGSEVCDDGANNGVPGYCAEDCTHLTEPLGTSNPDPSQNDLPYCDQLVS